MNDKVYVLTITSGYETVITGVYAHENDAKTDAAYMLPLQPMVTEFELIKTIKTKQ